ncbi:MAG: DUF4440 domain-containing protein [Methylocystaceae bacterium]
MGEIFLKEQLQKLEEQLLRQETRQTASTLDKPIGDSFMEFGSSGTIYNKEQTIEAMQAHTANKRIITDFEIRVLAPEVVLATYRLIAYGKQIKDTAHSLRSSIWQLTANGWQIIFHQGTHWVLRAHLEEWRLEIKFSASVLLVKEVDIARKFYEDILKQQVEADYGECVVYTGGFSIWDQEYAQKLIFGKPVTRPNLPHHDLELYFETEQLDEVYTRLREAQTTMLHTIQEQPWGQRALRVYDPDQYVVEIGEPMNLVIKRYLYQGMTAEQIAERTSMPLEMVEKIR